MKPRPTAEGPSRPVATSSAPSKHPFLLFRHRALVLRRPPSQPTRATTSRTVGRFTPDAPSPTQPPPTRAIPRTNGILIRSTAIPFQAELQDILGRPSK